MDMTEIMQSVSEYLAIILPAVTYVISGIVAIIRLSKIAKENKQDVTTATSENKTAINTQNEKIERLAQSNEELSKQVKRLCNKVDKIQE